MVRRSKREMLEADASGPDPASQPLPERTTQPLGVAVPWLMRNRRIGQYQELARKAGMTTATISRYVNGHRGVHITAAAMESVRSLADALGVEPEYFQEVRVVKAQDLVAQAMAEGVIDLEHVQALVEGWRSVRTGETDEG